MYIFLTIDIWYGEVLAILQNEYRIFVITWNQGTSEVEC